MAGLYVHIPFCVKKCDYCDFYSVPDRLNLFPVYVDAVAAEAKQYSDISFETLYVGGGTPSLLGADGIRRLTASLKKTLDLSEVVEATTEANPESAKSDFFSAAKNAGINRVSIGIQSLSDAELRSVGRIHTAKQAVEALSKARRAGFPEISCDIIVGLPEQDFRSLATTLETVVGAGVAHVSMYCLSLEDGTPLAANPPGNLPSEDMQAELFERARDLLLKAGFVHYEVSNFALPGHECRHNLNYWRGGEYAGLGAGAASHIRGQRFKNRGNLDAYIKDPLGQVVEVEELNPKEKAGEEAILRLRLLKEGLDINELSHRYEYTNIVGLRRRLESLASEGLLICDGSVFRIPSERALISNPILARVIGD